MIGFTKDCNTLLKRPRISSMVLIMQTVMVALFLPISNSFIPISHINVNTPSKPSVHLMKASLGESMFKPVESATAANTIFPFLSRIIIKPSDARKLAVSLRNDYSDLTEFFVYSLLGFVVPLLGSLLRSKITSNVHQEDTPYKKSKTYHITNHISQGFRIGAVINLLEVAEELPAFNGDGPKLIINAISTTSFTIWAMFRILAFKNISLNFISGRFLKTKWPGLTNLGRKITDYIIYISTVFIILNSLGVDCRAALNTLFAFGGAGTLVLSLASQDIMKQLLSGISLSLLEPFGVGDEIKTGEGELDIGTVEKIGAYNTMIRGRDEVVMKIPNAELGANSISNLSIVDSSQVEQSLRFDHSTIDTIPRLVKEIKSEIKAACPKLISDSSRPFRVHWTEYGESFLQIDIDTRFNIKPHSDEYYDNKQEVLLAISRAIRKCNVRLYEDP